MSAETFEAECTCEPMPMRIYHGLPVIAAYDCTSCETHRMKVSA